MIDRKFSHFEESKNYKTLVRLQHDSFRDSMPYVNAVHQKSNPDRNLSQERMKGTDITLELNETIADSELFFDDMYYNCHRCPKSHFQKTPHLKDDQITYSDAARFGTITTTPFDQRELEKLVKS